MVRLVASLLGAIGIARSFPHVEVFVIKIKNYKEYSVVDDQFTLLVLTGRRTETRQV